MAQVKITGLTAAGALDGNELLPIVQSGTTVKLAASELDTLRNWHALKTPASASGSLAVDLESPAGFHITLTEDVTTLTFPNASASRFIKFTVLIEQDATGGWDITFPGSVQNPPNIASAAGAFTIATFATWDGGTTIHTLFTV